MTFIQAATLVAATVTTGLSAGLFFAYACSVMPGLAQASDRTFVEAMQRINVAILNAWFLVVFVGAFLLTGLAAALHLPADSRSVLPWVVTAFVLYGVGLVVTGRLNVPLNNALVAAGHPDGVPDLRAVRDRFERPWVRWHLVRTVAFAVAFGCLAWALVLHGRLG
jgi:uncharacterized membrane protein